MRRTARLAAVPITAVALAASALAGAPLAAQTSGMAPPATTEAVVERIAGADRIATAIAISRSRFPSAPAAVLARADEFADALAGAPLAWHLRGPLLLTAGDRLSPGVAAELDRLGVGEVVLLGGTAALSERVERDLAPRAVRRIAGPTRTGTAAAIADELPSTGAAYVVPALRFPDALAVAPLAAHTRRPILLTGRDGLSGETARALDRLGTTDVTIVGGPTVITPAVEEALADGGRRTVRRIAGRDRYATAAAVFDASTAAGLDPTVVWLASGDRFPDALAAGPAVAASGATLLLVPGDDLRRAPAPIDRLRRAPTRRVKLVGGTAAITRDAPWQVQVIRHAQPLPRGGLTLFPDRRMIAFYGNAESPAMGVLGEQEPDAAYERLARQAQPYSVGGRALLPTFELIVSIATAGPGSDGDYSRPTDPALIEKWLAAARRHGVYLLLDIQSGRTDFLTESKRYERFLREPDVGLALDPEWRMDDDEVPAQTIGSVDAAEVNAVADWLAGIVREERLPQKLLIVHQFRTDMVTNRDRIRTPAELALVFHMDGHGSRSQKLETYRHIHVDPATRGAWNGFKLFYDEDRDMFSPRDLLDTVRPVPDFISYQ